MALIVKEASKVSGKFESYKTQTQQRGDQDGCGQGGGGEEGDRAIDLPAAPQGSRVTPIGTLNPYMSRWSIRARVTSKGEDVHGVTVEVAVRSSP